MAEHEKGQKRYTEYNPTQRAGKATMPTITDRKNIRKGRDSTQEELKSAEKGFKKTAREQMNARAAPKQRLGTGNKKGSKQCSAECDSTRRCNYKHTGSSHTQEELKSAEKGFKKTAREQMNTLLCRICRQRYTLST